MSKTLLKICIGGLAGIGLGLIVGKRQIEKLEAERNELELLSERLEAERELMEMTNDSLRSANKLLTNLLLQDGENEEP